MKSPQSWKRLRNDGFVYHPRKHGVDAKSRHIKYKKWPIAAFRARRMVGEVFIPMPRARGKEVLNGCARPGCIAGIKR